MSAAGSPDDGSGYGIHPGSFPAGGVGAVGEPDDSVRGDLGPICTTYSDSAWLGSNRRASTKRSEDEHRDFRLGSNLKKFSAPVEVGLSGAHDKLGAAPGSGSEEPGADRFGIGSASAAAGEDGNVTPVGSSGWVRVGQSLSSLPPSVGEQSYLENAVGSVASCVASVSTPLASEAKSASPPSGVGEQDRTPGVGEETEKGP